MKIISQKIMPSLHKRFNFIIMAEMVACNSHLIRLMNQKFCKVEIIIRSEFTAYKSNPNFKLHSGEFQESLNRSDYVLCPRGSGNNSVRFYEVLSSGATPILIDSGSELPVIKDDKFWFSNIIKLGLFDKWKNQILADWLYLEQNDNYVNRQTQNREVFMKELNIKSYLPNLFEKYLK